MINIYLWQNVTWLFFHKLAINQNPKKNIHYEIFFNAFKTLIPCSMCREHYNQMLKIEKYNLSKFIKNNRIFELTVDIHNNVNKSTLKEIWTYPRALKHYNSFYLNFYDIKKFLLIYIYHNFKKGPEKTNNLIKMITSFSHIFPRINCRDKLINFQKSFKPNKENFQQWIKAYLIIIRNEM